MKKNFYSFLILLSFGLFVSCEKSSSKYFWQNSILTVTTGTNTEKFLVTDENIVFPLNSETELCDNPYAADLGKLYVENNHFIDFSSKKLSFSYDIVKKELIYKEGSKISCKKRIVSKNPLAGKTFKGKDGDDSLILYFTNSGLVAFHASNDETDVIPYKYDSSKNTVNFGWDDFYYNSKLGTLDIDGLLCYDVKETSGKDFFDGCDSKSLVGKKYSMRVLYANCEIEFFKDNISCFYKSDDGWSFGFYQYYPEKDFCVYAQGRVFWFDLKNPNENPKFKD